jgi:ketosteroid isomerase-like protein
VSRENLETVRAIYERWERGDYSAVDWADPEIEFSAPGGLNPEKLRGIEAMGREWAGWLSEFEGFESKAIEYLESGDQVLVLTRFSGRGRGSGVPIEEMPGAARFRLRDGKVVELAI